MRKLARLLVGIGLAGFFLWLIIAQIDFRQVRLLIGQAILGWLAAAVIFFFVGYACRIERWRIMLIHENPDLRWKDCARPLLASVAVNNILPFRAGDLLRAFGFSRQLNVSSAASVASLFVERLLDLLMIVMFAGLSLAYFGQDSTKLFGVGGGGLVCGAIVICVLLLFPSLLRSIAYGFCDLVSSASEKVGSELLKFTNQAFLALEQASNRSTMIRLIFYSIFAWVAEGFVFWCVALALPPIEHSLAAWLALAVGTLATIIPSTPGYIGTFDYFTAKAMLMVGNSLVASAAYAFLVHMVLWLPPTIVGGSYLLIFHLNNKFRGEAHSQ